jgi:hypothetical protein
MPIPVSAITSKALPRAGRTVTVTRPPSGVNLMALDSRLVTSCAPRTREPAARRNAAARVPVIAQMHAAVQPALAAHPAAAPGPVAARITAATARPPASTEVPTRRRSRGGITAARRPRAATGRRGPRREASSLAGSALPVLASRRAAGLRACPRSWVTKGRPRTALTRTNSSSANPAAWAHAASGPGPCHLRPGPRRLRAGPASPAAGPTPPPGRAHVTCGRGSLRPAAPSAGGVPHDGPAAMLHAAMLDRGILPGGGRGRGGRDEVENGRARSRERLPGHARVMAAQPQVHRMRPGGSQRHHDHHPRSGGAAACPVGDRGRGFRRRPGGAGLMGGGRPGAGLPLVPTGPATRMPHAHGTRFARNPAPG